jgi:feruloyl esterase
MIGRMTQLTIGVLAAAVLIASPVPDDTTAAATCESLARLALPNTTIRVAETVAAGAFTLPRPAGAAAVPSPRSFQTLPAFCRVAATLKPSADSDIEMEVWLPIDGWNGKFEAVGNGGWAGRINYSLYDTSLVSELRRGYATASTDTGHVSHGGDFDGSFAAGHPEQIVDFGYRAVHEMTIAAKAIVQAYYERPPSRSYFSGCSTGGRQGLMEAQRYPADYDGIVAGAPANYWTHLIANGLWNLQEETKNPAIVRPAAKEALVHRAVLNACDALDGVRDGIIENPARCRFDPAVLLCHGDDGADCLTVAQVEGVRHMYTTTRNPRTSAEIFPGLEPGSEAGWATFHGAGPFEYFKDVVFRDGRWDSSTLDLDKDVARADEYDHGTINAIDPNLEPFFRRGGKLLMYHGWSDPGIPPANSINYYRSVAAALGGVDKISDSLRLFMAPGMVHCGMSGSDGANVFDTVAALEKWVEQKQSPERIVASHRTGGSVDRTHPLCPYPQVAVYVAGDTTAAASFVCKSP